MPRHELYDDDGTTERELCTKCGDAFLAEHDDRFHCGRCGYTEWK